MTQSREGADFLGERGMGAEGLHKHELYVSFKS